MPKTVSFSSTVTVRAFPRCSSRQKSKLYYSRDEINVFRNAERLRTERIVRPLANARGVLKSSSMNESHAESNYDALVNSYPIQTHLAMLAYFEKGCLHKECSFKHNVIDRWQVNSSPMPLTQTRRTKPTGDLPSLLGPVICSQ